MARSDTTANTVVLPPGPDQIWSAADRALEAVRLTLASKHAPAGTTPKDVIWRKNKSRLYRYRRETPATQRTPIFFTMPLINRTYVIDISPGNSLVEFLLGQGFDVFMYDWGIWGPEDRKVDIDDLMVRYLPRAVREARKVAGADMTMLGYCIGGTLAAIYAALYPDSGIKNLVLFTAPIDFANAGNFGLWVAKGAFPLEKVRETLPVMPGELIDVGSKMLSPLPNTVGNFVRLWEKLEDPNFDTKNWQAMNRWVNEGTPFPMAAYYQWIKEFYWENRLMKGTFLVEGCPVNLENIRIPLLNVAAAADAIAPRTTTEAIMGLASSKDKEELLLPGGHVGIVVGRGARNHLWPGVARWLGQHD